MYFRAGVCSLLLISLIFAVIPSVFAGNSTTCSFVHLSDTQNLGTYYPDTYNFTFAYLDSIRVPYTISGIIITGDLVNTWNSRKEWDTYSRARNHTTIPVYTIAGNHDADSGRNYGYYTLHTGEPEANYLGSVCDLDLTGINYADRSLAAIEFSRLRGFLKNSSRSNAIIATHHYMDNDGKLSPLGEDIDKNLIVKPSLVLTGHEHANFITRRTVGGFPVVADMTDYQDGVPGGTSGWDYSAGTLYTVTSINGQAETITARVIHIYPTASFDEEKTVFSRNPDPSSPAVMDRETGTFPPASPTPPCSAGNLSCILEEFFQQCCTNIRHVLP